MHSGEEGGPGVLSAHIICRFYLVRVIRKDFSKKVSLISRLSRVNYRAVREDSADGDCSHEIKRRLLLGRKVMTNLDSIFKSRDITLPTKVCLIKAMVFPVVMYGCESWTVKKAER